MVDIKTLFSRLDFTHPALAEARLRLAAGDEPGALRVVIDHFRTRTSPTYLFDESDIAAFDDKEVIQEADQICQHVIFGYALGPVIDWHFNPTIDSSRDPEWLWSLARHNFWATLARAYALTGDEKYACEFVSQLKDFVASWPMAPHMAEADSHMAFPGNAWRSIEAGIRIYTVWLPVMVYFRRSPSWDDEGWVCFLNALHDHAEFLCPHYSNHTHASNWLTMESTSLFQLGVMFPEFRRASEWKQLGYRRVMHEVRYQFDHHGVHIERTPIYHLVAAGAFLQAFRIATLNDIPVPPYMLPILEKSAEYLMLLLKPDLSLPMVGDADRNTLLDRRADPSLYEGMNLTTDPCDMNELRAFFRTMADLTGREDFRYLATCRQEGMPPAQKNYSLPDPGFHVLRTGWQDQDSYALVTGTQLERGESRAHSHFDAGHLELQVEGEDVLVDTGRFIYSNSAWHDWRDYFYSSQAHNTVGVDNHKMGDVPDTSSRIRCLRTFCHRFEPGPDVDLIEVSHNGYAFMEQPVFHLRRVIWFKPGVWLIDDVLTGTGNHTYNLSFNFAPRRLRADDRVPGAYIYHGDRVRMSLLPLLRQGLQSRVLEGSLVPKGGWVSFGYAVKIPAPQLIYTRVGPAPARFLTALVREDKGEVHREDEGDDLAIVLGVNSGNKIWRVTFGGETQQWRVGWQ
ncbi:MAG: alginate lyase family protein [Anaerolineae bacterium]|nr:alginate lyase family protein [Anaerolineae bacterium]